MKDNSRKCAKCNASSAREPSLVLHRFPKPGPANVQRMVAWAKFSYPDEDWNSVEFITKLYTSHKMLCSKHFPESAFVEDNKSQQKKLHRYAVPLEHSTTTQADVPTRTNPAETSHPGTSKAAEKPKPSSLEQQTSEEVTADTPELAQPEDLVDAEGLAQPETDEDSNHASDSEIQQEPPSWSSVKDVCRACLSKSGTWDLTETYLSEDGENERLLDMLTLCYGIKLSNVSECSASRFLCDVCAASLRHADSFRRQVRRAEGSFADYYGADDEIKEEYLDDFDEHEILENEVSCTNKPDESTEQESSNALITTQTPSNISESPSPANIYHGKHPKPSVEGSTKTAPQKHSMSEVSYSEKYIRVISYSANKNVKNSSASKEINIASQPAEEFENDEESDNASHCDEDLLYSNIKRRKIDQSKQTVTHPIHTTQPEKSSNALQTVKRDSIDLRQLVKVANPKKHVMTIQPLSKTNPKTMKRKNSSDMNIGESNPNVSNTNTKTRLEKSVQQSVSSNSIDFSQSVKITLPGNKVIKFLPLSTKDAGSVITKLGGKQMLEPGVPVKVDVTKTPATLLVGPIVKEKKSGT